MSNGNGTKASPKEWIAGVAIGLAIAVSVYGSAGMRERLARLETKIESFGEDLKEIKDDLKRVGG